MDNRYTSVPSGRNRSATTTKTRMISSGRIIAVTLLSALTVAVYASAQQLQPKPGTTNVKEGSDHDPHIAVAEKGDKETDAKHFSELKTLRECSLSKTNNNCRITIDRRRLVSPPTIQMYSGQKVTVVLASPYPFERYFLDYTSGQASLRPDVASSIVQGLLPSLQKLGFKAEGFDFTNPPNACASFQNIPKPNKGSVQGTVGDAQKCLQELARRDMDIYRKLEPLAAPDSILPTGMAIPALDCNLVDCISTFIELENSFSTKVGSIISDSDLKKAGLDDVAIGTLTSLQKLADTVATDLQGYKQRIADIQQSNPREWGVVDCKEVINIPGQCLVLQSKDDDPSIYHNMVTRTITYSVNTLNLVSSSLESVPDPTKKKLLATITLNFAEGPKSGASLRWEASAGAFFSSLPVRSFSVAPVFTNGAITNKLISQNLLYPTVAPFAAANFRITNDLGWSRWKSNIYWTGAVGINPNTVSADFASGISLSWRALMVSGLCHFGHDVRLTQGLRVGESLGGSFSGSLPTATYWVPNFALGLSIRVPSLTGR